MVVIPLAAVCGAGVGFGLVLLVVAARGRGPSLRVHREWTPRLVHMAASAVAGLLVGGVARWPVAALLVGVGTFILPRFFLARAHDRRAVDVLDALAVWTEMLRDTLHASAGIEGAIHSTAKAVPTVLRPAVRGLALRIEQGARLDAALPAFADDVDHHIGDLVVAALCSASESQAMRLADQLGALASFAREEAAVHRRIETERAGMRATVRVVVGVTVGLALLLTVLNPSYFAPFGTPAGQFVLLVGPGACFTAGFVWMWHLSRPSRPRRFLGAHVGERRSAWAPD